MRKNRIIANSTATHGPPGHPHRACHTRARAGASSGSSVSLMRTGSTVRSSSVRRFLSRSATPTPTATTTSGGHAPHMQITSTMWWTSTRIGRFSIITPALESGWTSNRRGPRLPSVSRTISLQQMTGGFKPGWHLSFSLRSPSAVCWRACRRLRATGRILPHVPQACRAFSSFCTILGG